MTPYQPDWDNFDRDRYPSGPMVVIIAITVFIIIALCSLLYII
jgi:hypothetical protein